MPKTAIGLPWDKLPTNLKPTAAAIMLCSALLSFFSETSLDSLVTSVLCEHGEVQGVSGRRLLAPRGSG
jgi:hypothetical protein